MIDSTMKHISTKNMILLVSQHPTAGSNDFQKR